MHSLTACSQKLKSLFEMQLIIHLSYNKRYYTIKSENNIHLLLGYFFELTLSRKRDVNNIFDLFLRKNRSFSVENYGKQRFFR